MNLANQPDQHDDFVRALSHDMSANFMLLESSFAHLKKSLDGLSGGVSDVDGHSAGRESLSDLGKHAAHVDACLHESRRLLDDLAQLARTGTVEMEPRRVELMAVVDEVLFEQDELLQHRGIEAIVQTPLPVFWCNPGRLKQIVTNLIRNAACHGCDPKRPRIVVSPATVSGTKGHGMAAFHVGDNGPGLDPRLHREIFLPGRRYAHEGIEGSGMGLAIVKKLVVHYGGTVCIDPEFPGGTAFLVTLPSASAIAEPTSSAEPAMPVGGPPWQLELDGRHSVGSRPRYGPLSAQPHHRDR